MLAALALQLRSRSCAGMPILWGGPRTGSEVPAAAAPGFISGGPPAGDRFILYLGLMGNTNHVFDDPTGFDTGTDINYCSGAVAWRS